MYDFLDKLCGEIDSGVITTFERDFEAVNPGREPLNESGLHISCCR